MSTKRTWLILAAAGALLLAAAACDDSETIAPDGSTISLTANPAQVIIVGGIQITDVTILATVRNSIGVPLPGQDVRFTTTNGTLTPPGGTPVETDDLGNATCELTLATQGPQITATSGKASANITLSAGSAPIAFLILTPSDDQVLADCSESIEFTATATDANNDPVDGVRIFFESVTNGNPDAVAVSFNPSNEVTDTTGSVTTTMTYNTTVCNANCPEKNCGILIQARDQSGFVFSNQVVISDNID